MSKKLGEIFEDKNARYIEDHGISRHGISRNYCIREILGAFRRWKDPLPCRHPDVAA